MANIQAYSSEQMINALRETNGLISLAAKKLGCVPQTIYSRAKSVQSVQQAIDESRDELVDYAELALRSAVISKEPWAVQFTLKTLGKNRGYVERQEVTGNDGGPLEHRDIGLTDDERAARIAAILDAARARQAGQADPG